MAALGEKRPIERLPLTVIFQEESDAKETYGGGFNTVLLEGQFLKPKDSDCETVLIFMHPTGLMNWLPMPIALAHMGFPVMCCGSRYPHNDATLIMEKVVVDLGRYVKHAKEELGFRKVILAGWSGGGSLSMFYQAEAEDPSVTSTPAGDMPDLTKAGLEPADAVLQLAAHVSRAITLSEWIDASILDENDPSKRDPELDLYNPDNPNQPPYSEEFLTRYRAAQKARIRRITAWVKDELAKLKTESDVYREKAFVVHGTMADPRWLDPAVDPNDRKSNWCYMGDPEQVNDLPPALPGTRRSAPGFLNGARKATPMGRLAPPASRSRFLLLKTAPTMPVRPRMRLAFLRLSLMTTRIFTGLRAQLTIISARRTRSPRLPNLSWTGSLKRIWRNGQIYEGSGATEIPRGLWPRL